MDAVVLAELSGVKKSFGKTTALDGLDLQIRKGELLAVLGANGAGKSTAIALMLGLLKPDEGSVRLFGEPAGTLNSRRRIGVMMQEVALTSELRTAELIDMVTSYYPAPYSAARAMEITHTTALANRPYGKLSGGQKRQVQYAMAVCGRPQLLFLDEPTVGLDIQARETIWGTIRGLIDTGCSIVLTTHYLEEAEALADRVAVFVKGRVAATGTVNDMRALVSRRTIKCTTRLRPSAVQGWEGVESATYTGKSLHIIASNTESVVRKLLAADESLRDLEIARAGLTEAFSELTREAA